MRYPFISIIRDGNLSLQCAYTFIAL